MRTKIFIKTSFEACHRWKDAPPAVSFLRNYHRHVFHVKVELQVSHNDRQLEFFMVRRSVDRFLKKIYAGRSFDASCERIATTIFEWLWFTAEVPVLSVEVNEDNENGAVVYKPEAS